MGPSFLARFGRRTLTALRLFLPVLGQLSSPVTLVQNPWDSTKPHLCVPRGWDFRDGDVHTTHCQWGEPILGRVSSSASPSPGLCVLAEVGEMGWWHLVLGFGKAVRYLWRRMLGCIPSAPP